jgi:hypothetical protein
VHLTLSALWNAGGRKSHPGKAHLPQRRPCAFQKIAPVLHLHLHLLDFCRGWEATANRLFLPPLLSQLANEFRVALQLGGGRRRAQFGAPYSERAPGQSTESLLGCGATVSATIYYVPVLAAFMHILPTFAILYALLLPPLGQCFLLALPSLCLACLGSPDCAGWLSSAILHADMLAKVR